MPCYYHIKNIFKAGLAIFYVCAFFSLLSTINRSFETTTADASNTIVDIAKVQKGRIREHHDRGKQTTESV